MEDKVQPQGWRDSATNGDEPSERWTAEDKMRHKLLGPHEHAKFSPKSVLMKKALINDLRTVFKKKLNEKDHIGVHKLAFIKKHTKKVKVKTSTFQTAAVLMIKDQDNEISELVTAIQSPQFKINEKGNLNKTNSLLSACKTDALTNRPLVENGSIHCDSNHVSGGVNHSVPHMDINEQTISMGH